MTHDHRLRGDVAVVGVLPGDVLTDQYLPTGNMLNKCHSGGTCTCTFYVVFITTAYKIIGHVFTLFDYFKTKFEHSSLDIKIKTY